MNLTVMILFVVALAAFAAYMIYKNYKTKNATDPKDVDWSKVQNGDVAYSREHTQHTPKGATVFSFRGVSDRVLALVDEGLDEVFVDARTSGYTRRLEHAFYEIYIPKYDCVPSPESRTPSFLIRADAYDGTEWDYYNPEGAGVRDGIGVVYAAEMVLDTGNIEGHTKGKMICCSDESVIKNATRHGAEHIIIANNDPVYFSQTWFHDTINHPLLPKREIPTAVGFKAADENVLLEWLIKPVK